MHMHLTELKAINPRVCPEFDDLFKRGISRARAIYREMISVIKLLSQLTELGVACTSGDVVVDPSFGFTPRVEDSQAYNTRLVYNDPCNPLQTCMGRRRMPFVMVDNYALLSCINEGSVGRVHLAVRLTDSKVCAVKVINRGHLKRHGSLYRRLKDELTVATSLRHDYLVETCGLVATRRTILIVMEYCDGGDLISIVKRFGSLSEDFTRRIFHMILEGVACMHSSGYCHRDLKLENILLKSVDAFDGSEAAEGVRVQGQPFTSVQVQSQPFTGVRVQGGAQSESACNFGNQGSALNPPRVVNPQICKWKALNLLKDANPLKVESTCGTATRVKTPGSRACNPTSTRGSNKTLEASPTSAASSCFIIKIGDFGAATRDDSLLLDTVGTMSYAAPEVLNCRGTNGYSGKAADVWSLGVVLYAMLFGQLPWNTQEASIVDGYREVVTQPLEFPRAVSRQATELLRGMLCIDLKQRLGLRHVMEHPWLNSFGGAVDDFVADDLLGVYDLFGVQGHSKGFRAEP